jgi:uncharacterized repeat protein (TIGR01451 family)
MPAQRRTNQGKRLTGAGLIAVTAATLLMMGWAIFPTAAFADGTITWDGSKGLPAGGCTLGAHWVLSPAQGITSATLHIGGQNIAMDHQGANFDADSSVPVSAGMNVSVTYVGTPTGNPTLKVSHCLGTPGTPVLDITKTASTTQVTEGGAFSYTITVENAGDASATNVVVTDDLDNNLTGVSVSASQGACDPVGAGNTIECDLGTIAAGASATVTINATAPQLPLPGTNVCQISIANTAFVDSDETDKVSDDAPSVTVTGTGCETTTTTTPPGGGGGGGMTTTPPPAPTTTTTTTPTVAPTTIHNTSTTPAAEVLPTTVRPGKLAFTGIEDVVPIGALALTLMTTGSGLLWAGSRRRRHDGSEDED